MDVLSALVCLGALVLLLQMWQPATAWRFEYEREEVSGSPSTSDERPATGPASGFAAGTPSADGGQQFKAFLPYIILVVVVIITRSRASPRTYRTSSR